MRIQSTRAVPILRLSGRAPLMPIILNGVVEAITPKLAFGSGISLLKAMAPAFKRVAGITLSFPPEENTHQLVPIAAPLVTPVVGSKTIPCCNGTVPPSVVQTVTPGTTAPRYVLKSPAFMLSVGTMSVKPSAVCCQVPSQFAKKKSLFFLMGPPTVTPSLLRMPVLLLLVYQFFAFRALSVWNA